MACELQVNIPMSQTITNSVPERKCSSQDPTVVSFHSICYRVKQKSGFLCSRKTTSKDILRNLNGIMRPGMNAILGPTGGGKSSLLDTLAARKDPYGLSGDVLINGVTQPANFKCISGYVVQDDVVMGTLTVRENLQFSAALRLPRTVSEQEKEKRVDQVIRELGLTKVMHSKVGTQFIHGISGGERKRTSIGMELITDPAVLFLDEPTTGLDASTANAVLLLLKRMSREGKTIIFSIHQPRYSIFKLFDNLTLLAEGRMLYHGPAQNALEYFKTLGYKCEPYNNPADFLLDVINGEVAAVTSDSLDDIQIDNVGEHFDPDGTLAARLAQKYSSSDYFHETQEELQKLVSGNRRKMSSIREITYTTSFFHQLKWVSKRSFKNMIGSPEASVAQLLVTLFLGLVLGVIFFDAKNDATGLQNRIGAMFFVTTNQCFSSISAIELFVAEKKIFIHEYISGYYRISAYFFSKLIGDLIPLRTFPSIIFTCTIYFMIGFKPTAEAFFIMMLTLMMVSYASTSMALAIATGHGVVAVAHLLITITFIFMGIFSGLLVNLTSILPVLSWLQYFSIPQYGLTALQVNEFIGLKFCNITINSNWNDSHCEELSRLHPCTGEKYLYAQGIDATKWGLWQNHVAMACMTVIFLTIAYMKLLFMKKFS